LNGLVAERLAVAVLQCSEQRPVPHLRLLEVAPQQAYELWVIERYGAALPTFAEDVEMLVVASQIKIVHIKRNMSIPLALPQVS